MNPPTLYWSAELAGELQRGEPLDGLIHGDSYGLFCFQLREWARLAALPDDAVPLVPAGHADSWHRQTGGPQWRLNKRGGET